MATVTVAGSSSEIAVSHTYHAEAHALSGNLERPIKQEIEHQAKLSLNDMEGGHFTRLVEKMSVHGLVFFEQAHTRVSGSRSLKHRGWVTTSTSVVEGLNVFEVIHADRLVSQVSTDHPYENGHVPRVTFLGTHFDNLRVSGFQVKFDLDLGICGARPENGGSYFDDANFLARIKKQTNEIYTDKDLPAEMKPRYEEQLDHINNLVSVAGKGRPREGRRIKCSLVEDIGKVPVPGFKAIGNLMVIPEFGTATLGDVLVREEWYEDSEKPSIYFELTSLHMKLGCVGDGSVQTSTVATNGRTKP
jgi:hypothetical protein